MRIRDDRVFYTDPEPPDGGAGRPHLHGHRRTLAESASWPDADATLTATDDRYGRVRVDAWHDLHPKLDRRGHWKDEEIIPIVRGTIVRVDVEHLPKPTSRSKKILWLWIAGPDVDLDLCWRAYLRRFDAHLPVLQEHPGLDRPFTVYSRTGRPVDLDHHRRLHPAPPGPHSRRRPPSALGAPTTTPPALPGPHPAQISPTSATLIPVASAPKSRTPGPGRPRGTKTGRRTRYPALKTAA
ncbi:MAG TPA: hypothetical protein VK053_17460 [Jiangellaceae bacterium]|nr:hypothetical protein [Jiangellaceae bacterium]